jgi:hypothetical protein
LLAKDHRRRQVAGSRGRQKVIHRGVQKGNSTHREKASNFVREIRQEVDDRKSDRQKYRQGMGKKASLVRMAKNYDTQED